MVRPMWSQSGLRPLQRRQPPWVRPASHAIQQGKPRPAPPTPDAIVAIASAGCAPPAVAATSPAFLAALGSIAARAGGASVSRGALRVAFWGALAMAITTGAGSLFDVVA
jgi:hypothetical protein